MTGPLTNEVFVDTCRAVWGEDWKAKASKFLKRSERQLYRIEHGRSKVMPALRKQLADVLKEQIDVTRGLLQDIL